MYGINLISRELNGEMFYCLYNGHADILRQILIKILKCCPVDTNQDGFINEKNNIKYAGYFYDGETGLYYLNARFYDPETARFIQEDTYRGGINDPLSLNLYTYSHNNPISYYDPTGHSIKKLGDMFKIAAALATIAVTTAVKPKLEKASKSVNNFMDGVAASTIKNMLVEPALVVKSVANMMAFPFKNMGKDISQKERAAVDDLEHSIRENLVSDKVAFDAGRVLGDVINTVQGGYEVAAGLTSVSAGLGGTTLGTIATALTGGGAAPVVVVSSGAVVAGSAAVLHGGLVMYSSYKNMQQNSENFRKSVAESKASKSQKSTSNKTGDSSKPTSKGSSSGGVDSKRILGENGTQFDSKTTWQNGKTERIDVENPSPGERPGQIHYHEPNNKKWYLDIEEKQFYNQKTGELAPKSIQKLLKDKDVHNAINKGLKFLGEDILK